MCWKAKCLSLHVGLCKTRLPFKWNIICTGSSRVKININARLKETLYRFTKQKLLAIQTKCPLRTAKLPKLLHLILTVNKIHHLFIVDKYTNFDQIISSVLSPLWPWPLTLKINMDNPLFHTQKYVPSSMDIHSTVKPLSFSQRAHTFNYITA